MFILYIVLIFINILYGLYINIKKEDHAFVLNKNKNIYLHISSIFFAALFLVLFVIAKNTRGIADFDSYKLMYYHNSNIISSPGYKLISQFAYKNGLTFIQFRTIIYAIALILLYFVINQLNDFKNIIGGIYAIFPYTFDVIQMRNFLAFSIVLFGLYFLFTKEKIGKPIFILLVALASTIHLVSIVYYSLLLSHSKRNEESRKKILIFIFIFIIGLSLLTRFIPSMMSLMISLFITFNSERGTAYTSVLLNWGFVIFWLMYLLYFAVIIIGQKSSEFEYNLNNILVYEPLYLMNLCLTIYLPLLLININFYRIYRNFSIINYISLPMILRQNRFSIKLIGVMIFSFGFILNISQSIGVNPWDVYFPIFGIFK